MDTRVLVEHIVLYAVVHWYYLFLALALLGAMFYWMELPRNRTIPTHVAFSIIAIPFGVFMLLSAFIMLLSSFHGGAK